MDRIMGILGIISRVLIIIVLIATSLLSIGTAYIMFAPDALPKPFRLLYDFNPPTAAETTPEVVEVEVEPGKGIIVAAGTKIINLNGTNGNKYIRVTVSLEFNPTNPAYSTMTAEAKATYLTEFNTEIASKMAIIDDTIITCIALKTFDQLYTAEGKESLRRELMEKLHARIEEPKIIALYFTEFVIN